MSQAIQLKPRNPLLQPDIFLCVLDCLDTPKQYFQSRGKFCALARTCRAFSEPALDRLWYMLLSLDPLIRCYAPVLNEETAKTPPSLEEWVVIHRYSHRVKELSITMSIQFSFLFLQAISLYPSLLLPNLRILIWEPWLFRETHLALPTLIQPLLSPSLTALKIKLSDKDDPILQSFLANYPLQCPNLKAVALDLGKHPAISDTTVKVLSRAVIHSKHIECLQFFVPVDDVALTHFALSPELTKLKILALVLHPTKSNLHRVSIPSDAVPFRHVESLNLQVWDLHFVTSLLRTQDQEFHSFALYHHAQPTIESVHALFAALASCQRTDSLRSISLLPGSGVTLREPNEFSVDQCVPYETFRPLSPLCHLRRLVIDLSHWISINDDELVTLARNWPSLQVLHLSCRQRLRGYPWTSADIKYITFKGLLSLLEICPEICDLCLPVDARKKNIPADKRDIIYPKVTDLSFPSSPISDSRSVKKILARHFPSVGEVSIWFNHEHSLEISRYEVLWEDVNDYLARLAWE